MKIMDTTIFPLLRDLKLTTTFGSMAKNSAQIFCAATAFSANESDMTDENGDGANNGEIHTYT